MRGSMIHPRCASLLAGLAILCGMLFTWSKVAAQLPLEVNGLRGGRHVGSAAPPSRVPRAIATFGYAYTEDVLQQDDSHQRLFGELGAAYAARPHLQLAARVLGRYDSHRGAERDDGGAFETELTSRHAFALSEALFVAAQGRLRFPAAESAGRGFKAVSPELRALASSLLSKRYELTLNAGYRFDRSMESVADHTQLSAADRLAAELSGYDAALLGLLFVAPAGPLTMSLEWSWDVALGDGAPSPVESPMRVRLAAQMRLASRYVPGIELGFTPSARPELRSDARIEPRLWAALSFGVLFERQPTRAPAAAPVARAAPPAEPAAVSRALRVTDPAGAPLADASVTFTSAEGEQQLVTDASGLVVLRWPPASAPHVAVRKEGFQPKELDLPSAPSADAPQLTVALERVLPDGEIKGSVRSLRGGKPLRSRITVQPLGLAVETDAKGSFQIDVPPGEYTLEISAEGHEPQRRQAHVELRGVTILVVDLRRSTK